MCPLAFVDCLNESHLAGIDLARGYFDHISYTSGELTVTGWILLPTQAFDSIQVLVNGHVAESGALVVRDDVAKAFPQILHAARSGFRFHLGHPPAVGSRCRIDVLGFEGGRALGRLSTLFRPDLDTAVPTPPPALMERVAATRDPMFFKIGGLKAYGEFLAPILRHRPLGSISRMLDWGCGCGRVVAHFLTEPEIGAIHGCDIDSEAVGWCAAHLPRGEFRSIAPWPPTSYAGASFDVVIAFSVFTHLAKDVQKAWLAEMRRIIAPGGLFLASTHGTFAAAFDGVARSPRLLREGILDDIHDDSLGGIAPKGYYRGVFQTPEYTRREWSKYFEVLEYVDRGMGSFQDLVVMRRSRERPGRFWSMFPWARTANRRPDEPSP